MLSIGNSVRKLMQTIPGVGRWLDLSHGEPLLSAAEVAQFHERGYLVIEPDVAPDVLDAAIAGILPRDELKAVHHGTRVFNGWKDCAAIKEIALAPRVLRMLRQLYGRKPRPFQTLNFPIGTEQKVHSDVIHFNSDPFGFMCGVWVALEDIDRNNGALVYYPGSQKLPVITMDQLAPGPGPEHYHLYEAYVEKMVQEKQLQPDYAILKKGQALIWSANLLHGGSFHIDKARTRHSQVTHYFFSGCQYYMPLSSYGKYRHKREEEWIS